VVMRKTRQALVHKLYAAAVKERAIARHRDEHGPTTVIRYADDAATFRNGLSSLTAACRVTPRGF